LFFCGITLLGVRVLGAWFVT